MALHNLDLGDEKKMQDQLKKVKEKIKSYGLNREGMKDLKKYALFPKIQTVFWCNIETLSFNHLI